jgi:hypothetical protein
VAEERSDFERDATRTPLWLPVLGVIAFLLVVVVAVMCPGRSASVADAGATRSGQGER